MNAPATNAMAAIIQSRACMSLIKSISTSSIFASLYYIHNTRRPRFQGAGVCAAEGDFECRMSALAFFAGPPQGFRKGPQCRGRPTVWE